VNKIEIPIVNLGIRVLIYRIRSVFIILLALGILSLVIVVPFIHYPVIESIYIFFLLLIVCSISLIFLLSFRLFFSNKLGVLEINDANIRLRLSTTEIDLDKLVIILNLDESEFIEFVESGNAGILSVGNSVLYSEDLARDQKSWELLVSKSLRKELLDLRNRGIVVKPMFDRRPILMESPRSLFIVFSKWLLGWR